MRALYCLNNSHILSWRNIECFLLSGLVLAWTQLELHRIAFTQGIESTPFR